jgi:hypothetical protein
MQIKVNLNGGKRKELVRAIGEILDIKPIYKGLPSYNYAVGDIVIDRDAVLTVSNKTDGEEANGLNKALSTEIVSLLMSGLRERGFECDMENNSDANKDDIREETSVTSESNCESLPEPPVIQVPLKGFDDAALKNLILIVAAKANLIKKAINTDNLSIEKADDALRFHWFKGELEPEEISAYTCFIEAVCEMAKRQKRVLATEKDIENEKYAFRCFLLRLGFIGEEYARARRILLRNLSGNGSWKSDNGKDRLRPKNRQLPDDSVEIKTGHEKIMDKSKQTAKAKENTQAPAITIPIPKFLTKLFFH